MDYDSRVDTYQHIATVRGYLLTLGFELILRGENHDSSKLYEPELSMFNKFTPKLRASTYGSDEYNQFLEQMGVALRHHYDSNDHHPEHFDNGIHDMDLIQLIEMLADWKAATLRHDDGNLGRSILQNAERFGYDEKMSDLLLRTADNLGWID
jgi:Family of unknown function (DUF5662)